MIDWANLEFAQSAALLLAVLAIPVAVLAYWRGRRAYAIPSAIAIEAPRPSIRQRLASFAPLLRVAAVVLLAIAIARPRVGEANAVVESEGIDIALAVDISSSMTTGNFGEGRNRLEATRDVIRDFIASRENDRIGIVVFQEDAIPLAPPSLDYSALDAIVADLQSGLLPDGTGIGVGLSAALTMLQESSAASRVVILLTDGEQNAASISPEEAAELASALNIRVYTIGVGDESELDQFGGIDAELLEEVSERTGGRFFLATDADSLAGIYDEIGELETTRVGSETFSSYKEYGLYFAGAAAFLLLAELALRSTWLRRLP